MSSSAQNCNQNSLTSHLSEASRQDVVFGVETCFNANRYGALPGESAFFSDKLGAVLVPVESNGCIRPFNPYESDKRTFKFAVG